MLRKRRLTVHPVDAAQFCGYDNSMVVSFLNGIDHLVVNPAATDLDEAQPLPSRVVAHSYTGAQLANTEVETQLECVAEAAVSTAAVIACRVLPLTASTADPTAAYPVRAEGPPKIVFFSGCQRLAEVRLGAELTAATATTDVADAAACPMQCFRMNSSGAPGSIALDIAAFMGDSQTLCTCTPQLGKLQAIRFDDQRICCMGPGRAGKTEVTVVLSSGVAVLCGVPNTPPSSDEDEDAFDCEEQPASSASPSSTSTTLPAAARRAFAKANERSNWRILHTIQLPAAPSPASDATPAPRRVAWSGASTLWVVCADGSVLAVQCKAASLAQGAALRHTQLNEESEQPVGDHETEEPSAEATMIAEYVLQAQLTGKDGQRIPVQSIFTNADPRSPVLHFAFTSGSEGSDGPLSRLFYGSARVSETLISDGSNSPSRCVQWRLQSMPYDEQLYGVRFERGQYHILTQGCRGGGPLYIALLPWSSPVHTPQIGTAAKHADLAVAIMASPEDELANHCRACEDLLQELYTATQHLLHEDDAEVLLHRFMQAQHAVYALLSRQHQSLGVTDLAPSESLPYRLLQRATRLFRQFSAYVLLLRLGIVNTVTKPVREVLRLDEAAAISKAAQAQWASLMRDTFRSASVFQSVVTEHAMWQAPTPLCVDLLSSALGFSLTDPSCTMASVLNKMDALTTEYALFVLYYSYQVMGCAGDAKTAAPPHSVQQQQRQWRESFLLLFGQPIELNVWAFTCYAVDHSVNPAAQCDDAAGAPAVYILGPAVQHLGAPPFTKLFASVIHGLAHVAALDVLLHLIPSCLAVYNAAQECMPISVSMRILCVALRAGSHRMIEALYEVMRFSPMLQDLASQPLAIAALAARDVSGMRGWVEVCSPVAATIERTLQASESVRQRESVLISYYILLQRYEDALRVCTSATAADTTQAQRLQVVLSYLRSLLPASSAVWGEGEGEDEGCGAAPCAVDPLLPLDPTVKQPWSQTALAAPLLETSHAALSEELRRVAAGAERGSSKKVALYRGAGGVVAGGTASSTTVAGHPHHHGGGSAPPNTMPPLFRPSTLLMSLERGADSRGSSSPSPGSTVNQAKGL
ncbi:hypothetical protein ABL78_0758 [Leptomonas seymouri]|uniref:Uncharacterized protein n=1 Tax=Leptomonas seymouri TaxID=5684 RepID=A0A0N1IML2_LEPSE|nr:hypothetical protein ABL78_0758 [Leptomonas seymouri]|eukprot:KPI90113.1 hypothetical protein ABL78_0758 [Leptomonas seymouri]